MGTLVAGRVINPGTTNMPDSTPAEPGMGRQGDLLESQYHGRKYHANYRDRLFHGVSVVAGNSFPIYTATAFVYGIWNSQPDVALELLTFKAGYVSGTGVAGPFGYMTKNVGLAVGVPLSAFNPTPTGIRPGKIGVVAPGSSRAAFTNAATNTIVAGAAADWIPGNMYQPVVTAADATNEVTTMQEDFEGEFIIMPGMLWWPAALLASVSLFNMRTTWIENPL